MNSLPERILVVDDDEMGASLLAEALSCEGFSVEASFSGAHALSRLKEASFGLLICDVMMPGMTGLELSGRVREELDPSGLLPIILVSAMSEDEYKVAGLALADDYITKPYSLDELLARVRTHLRIRQLRMELAGSLLRYRTLFENVPILCASLDGVFRLTSANSGFVRCTGRSVGQSFLDVFDGSARGAVADMLGALEPGSSCEPSFPFLLAVQFDDGAKMYVRLQAARLADAGEDMSWIVSMIDVSRTIRLEEQQKIARQQLYRSARLASIGTLASGAAHEINNPLTAILGCSDSLLLRMTEGDMPTAEEFSQYLWIIRDEAMRCCDVIGNLSRFAADTGTEIVAFSLAESVRSAVMLAGPRMMRRSMRITVDVDDGLMVSADIRKISQVLVAVLDNCHDFCPDASTVTISGFSNPGHDRPVVLTVVDTGPGIAAALLPKVFDPFFTTKEPGRGIGLGLSIAHKLMEDCNGSIDVDHAPGCGTRVTLAFIA